MPREAGGAPPARAGEVLEPLEEGRELRSLLTRLVGDSRRSQEPAHGEALTAVGGASSL